MMGFLKRKEALIIQFGKFGIIGVIGFIVDWSFFHLAYDVFDFNNYASATFSFPFAVTATWIGNRLYTFKGQTHYDTHTEWARFFIVCIFGFVVNRGTFSLMTYKIPYVAEYPILGLIGGTSASMFFNFFFIKKHVFKEKTF